MSQSELLYLINQVLIEIDGGVMLQNVLNHPQMSAWLGCGEKRRFDGHTKSKPGVVWEVLESPQPEVFKIGEGNKSRSGRAAFGGDGSNIPKVPSHPVSQGLVKLLDVKGLPADVS